MANGTADIQKTFLQLEALIYFYKSALFILPFYNE